MGGKSRSYSFLTMFMSTARHAAKAPIPVFGIAGNYAQAIYGAASAAKAKPQVAKDLSALQEALTNVKVGDYMSDPFIRSTDKLNILNDVAKTQKMSPLTVNLFSVLAENNRISYTGEIAEIYGRIMQAEAGFTPVQVTSAAPLSAAQQKEVTAAVKGIVGGDAQNIEVTNTVNEDIIGGLIVSIGDKYTEMKHVDLSTSSKINKYSALLKQGV